MAYDKAYKVLQDTTIPRALYLLGETADGTKQYETEGISYDAGSYVLEEDITPFIRDEIPNGKYDHLLEEVDRDEALETLNAGAFSTFAPEHEVEHQALATYGHKIIPRDEVLKARSAGSDDAKKAQEAAKADGADERSGIGQFEGGNLLDDEAEAAQLVGVPDTQYVDAETALETEAQLTPSGVMATNPFVAKAAAADESTSETAAQKKKRLAAEKKNESTGAQV